MHLTSLRHENLWGSPGNTTLKIVDPWKVVISCHWIAVYSKRSALRWSNCRFGQLRRVWHRVWCDDVICAVETMRRVGLNPDQGTCDTLIATVRLSVRMQLVLLVWHDGFRQVMWTSLLCVRLNAYVVHLLQWRIAPMLAMRFPENWRSHSMKVFELMVGAPAICVPRWSRQSRCSVCAARFFKQWEAHFSEVIMRVVGVPVCMERWSQP